MAAETTIQAIQSIITQLADIAASPRRSIKAAMAQSGKKAVGGSAPYTPEEIIYAAGALPVGLWGGQVELKRARTYLQPFACSIMQSIVELASGGVYDDVLSAVVFSSPCDTLKCIGQKWKGACPSIQFTHPMNRQAESANAFLVSEYETLRRKLETILKLRITDEALSDSIVLYNSYRAAMREFTETAARYPKTISPVSRHQIIKAAYFMDKADYLPLIRDLTRKLRGLKPETWPGKKVVLTGITFEPEELLKVLEQYQLTVAADDLAQESRQFRTDVPWYKTPMASLAKQWQNHRACSLAFDPYKGRIDYLVNLVKGAEADGLILGLMQFCDPEEYDVPIIMEACEKAGIPFLRLDINQQDTGYEQAKTRIQSFAETL
jgi:benzoyl-CoA reductase/2-hydroxyglutaryl-CoA dehydratase subunit BcrC/BadD/HgdB